MQQNEKELPKLPINPTTLDRIIFAIQMLRYHDKQIVAICTLTTIKLTGFNGDIYHLEDKKKMTEKAKKLAHDGRLFATVKDNVITSGHLLCVKHNGQCVAIFLVLDPTTPHQITERKLPVNLVVVKDTFTGSGKKGDSQKTDAQRPTELSKQEKKAKRYERAGNLVSS